MAWPSSWFSAQSPGLEAIRKMTSTDCAQIESEINLRNYESKTKSMKSLLRRNNPPKSSARSPPQEPVPTYVLRKSSCSRKGSIESMPVLISAPFVEIPVALESGNSLWIVAISSLKKQCHCRNVESVAVLKYSKKISSMATEYDSSMVPRETNMKAT